MDRTSPTLLRHRELVDAYLTAREHVVSQGFGWEIDWQDTRDFEHASESDFLREAAWVVLSAGMAVRVVESVFAPLSDAFCQWSSASAIVERSEHCLAEARRIFRHERKLAAIVAIAGTIAAEGFDSVKARIVREGPEALEAFDYIGPVTCLHLAKNLGLDVVKPEGSLRTGGG